MAMIQTTPCAKCHQAVSPLGGLVKEAGKCYHIPCYTEPIKTASWNEGQFKALETAQRQREVDKLAFEERFEAYRKRVETSAKPRVETSVKSPVEAPVLLSKNEWDVKAEKVIDKFIANAGPLVPRASLRTYLFRLYKEIVGADLLAPLTVEEKPEEKPVKGPTLDEFFRRG